MTEIFLKRLFALVFSSLILGYASSSQACVEGCLFEQEETLGLEPAVSVVTTGDVNNDGLPDIVTAGEPGEGGIHIFLQGADHRFKPAESYYFSHDELTEPVGNSIDLGDFNSDSYVDIAVTTHSGIRVLFRNSLGQFGASLDFPMTSDYKLRVGDYNADGRDDIAAIGWGNQRLSIILQSESGSLESPVHYDANFAGWNDLEAGDLNNDGLTDIVVMSGQLNSADDISIFYQNSSGSLDAPTNLQLVSGNNPGGVGIGDIDGDGLNDLVVLDPQNTQLVIYSQNTSGALNTPYTINSGGGVRLSGAIEIADMNQDNLDDIALLIPYGSIAVHLQKKNGGFEEPIYSGGHASSQIDPHGLDLADLDGDGKTDAIVAKGYWMGGVDVHYATRADLELTLSSNKSRALVNEPVRYTASITNRGPEVSKGIKLEHTSPAGMFSTGTIFGSQGSCDTVRAICNLGALKPGRTATVTFEAYAYRDPGTFTNRVDLSAFDYSALARTASLDIDVTPGADLVITSNNANQPSHTTNLYYSAYVHNDGVIDAEDVVISDILPAGVTPVTAVWAMPWGAATHPCLISGGRVDCEIGQIPVDYVAVISIQVKVNTTADLLNSISVSSTTPDPDPGNNSVTRLSSYQGVIINQPPVIDRGGPYTTGLGSQLLLDSRASKDPEGSWLTFVWNFADGSQAWDRFAHHTFSSTGQVPVNLTVTDADGGVSSKTFIVEVVNTPPRAYAGPPFHLRRKKSDVLFDAEGSYDLDGGPLTYRWDFGDGATASGIRALHAYQLSGNYTATLTVSDGAADSVATAEAIVFNTIPYCSNSGAFTYRRNQPIDFNGSRCVDGNGDTLSYSWDFDDGGSSSEMNPTHTYTSSGVYEVTLIANDGEDDSISAVSHYTITNDAPIASGGGPYTAVKGKLLEFDGSPSSDADNDLLTYRWNFGDGIVATGVSPSHVYAKGGRYKVRLIVNDGEVDSDPYNTTVSVKNR